MGQPPLLRFGEVGRLLISLVLPRPASERVAVLRARRFSPSARRGARLPAIRGSVQARGE